MFWIKLALLLNVWVLLVENSPIKIFFKPTASFWFLGPPNPITPRVSGWYIEGMWNFGGLKIKTSLTFKIRNLRTKPHKGLSTLASNSFNKAVQKQKLGLL